MRRSSSDLLGKSSYQDQVSVGLVQINHPYAGYNVFPYSAGLMQSYAQANAQSAQRFHFETPIHLRHPVDETVNDLTHCDVVGFSTYVWNGRISLEIARGLRERNNNVVIIFGGPHVPDRSESFLRQHPYIDIAVHKEGERTFLALLEQFPTIDPGSALGVSFIDAGGEYRKMASAPRIRDLDEIPSPFLSGVFDPLIQADPTQKWVALWETNRGCPFSCTFCDWGSATAAKVHCFSLERLERELDWFSDNKVEIIYCCDANFGILQRDVDIARYVAAIKRLSGYPCILSVQNTKNATERAYETQKILSDAGLSNGIALAMQSVDIQTLKSIKRDNISLDTYDTLQHRFMNSGVDTYSDLILGLPGETYAAFVAGINTIIERGQHTRIRFNNLSILPNAEMAAPAYRKQYGIRTVQSQLIILPSSRIRSDDIPEMQELVIATNAMPLADWRRARVFSWFTSFLYFDKLVQIPFIVVHALYGIRYTELIGAIIDGASAHPHLRALLSFFNREAAAIQSGAPEYPYSEHLHTYWPTDEFAYLNIVESGNLDNLYDELQASTFKFLVDSGCDGLEAVSDAFTLNRALIKRPFVFDDALAHTHHNVMEIYHSHLAGAKCSLKRAEHTYMIFRTEEAYGDFTPWAHEVVVRGKAKGAYFYRYSQIENVPLSSTLAAANVDH